MAWNRLSDAAAYNLQTGPAVILIIVRAKEERVDVTALDQRFWQVRVKGEVVGYVDEIDVAGETRFRARRLRYPDGRWLLIGEWWELGSALAACADVPRSETRVRKLVVPPQNRWL